MLYAGRGMTAGAPTTLDPASASMCVLLVAVPNTGRGIVETLRQILALGSRWEGGVAPLHLARQRPLDLCLTGYCQIVLHCCLTYLNGIIRCSF